MKELKAFRLDTELLKELESIAQKENRSLSNVVETLLKEKIKDLKRKKQ